MFKIQSSKTTNPKVQYSKLKVQRQSPHIAISAILRDNSCAEVIQGGPRYGAKKISLQSRKTTGKHPMWALTDSNRRPSACKADALNQLS